MLDLVNGIVALVAAKVPAILKPTPAPEPCPYCGYNMQSPCVVAPADMCDRAMDAWAKDVRGFHA